MMEAVIRLELSNEELGVMVMIVIVGILIFCIIRSWFDDGTFNESWSRKWRKYPNYITDRDRFNACACYTHLIKTLEVR